jgi:hypothetical protein
MENPEAESEGIHKLLATYKYKRLREELTEAIKSVIIIKNEVQNTRAAIILQFGVEFFKTIDNDRRF